MTRPIPEEEVKENILRLKNNKSPGVDGLPGEYYKTLANELTPPPLKILTSIIANKTHKYIIKLIKPDRLLTIDRDPMM